MPHYVTFNERPNGLPQRSGPWNKPCGDRTDARPRRFGDRCGSANRGLLSFEKEVE
jgi:hypothetical protein